MTQIRNLNDIDVIEMILSRLDALEGQAPAGATSLGSGTFRVYNGGVILVENGGIRVIGWADIIGALNGTGNLNWSGKAHFDGPVEITDTLKVLAATTLEGLVKLMNNLELTPLGKIIVGKMRIDPTVGQGAVVFENGGQVFSDATTVQVYKGNGVAQISDTEARIQLGGKAVSLTPSGFRFLGVPKATKAGVPAGCYYKGTDGYVYEA